MRQEVFVWDVFLFGLLRALLIQLAEKLLWLACTLLWALHSTRLSIWYICREPLKRVVHSLSLLWLSCCVFIPHHVLEIDGFVFLTPNRCLFIRVESHRFLGQDTVDKRTVEGVVLWVAVGVGRGLTDSMNVAFGHAHEVGTYTALFVRFIYVLRRSFFKIQSVSDAYALISACLDWREHALLGGHTSMVLLEYLERGL